MTLLYPRLPHADAAVLAEARASLSVEQARALAKLHHPRATYASTGGVRAQRSNLESLAAAIRGLAGSCGYPGPRTSTSDRFDGRLGRLLHERSGLSPSEACREGVWSFLACVLVPDVVRWRFPGPTTSVKNFLGGDRGIDHALGRCWWAAQLLREDDSPDDPYELLLELGVDELVGFSRRTRAVVSRRVARSLARELVELARSGFPLARLELTRDVMRRFSRQASVLCFEALSEAELADAVRGLVRTSARQLARAQALDYEPPAADPPAREAAQAQGLGSELAGTPAQGLSAILAEIELDSRSPSRFMPLKRWFAQLTGLDPEAIAIKRLRDAKNYRNRIGEGLRQRPKLALFLHEQGCEQEVLDALESRLHISPDSAVLLAAASEEGGPWRVGAMCAAADAELASVLGAAFEGARALSLAAQAEQDFELPQDVERHIVETLAALPIGEPEVLDRAADASASLLAGLEGQVRAKRINDPRNLGNRISEGLGVGASVLLLGVPEGLWDAALDRARGQFQGARTRMVVLLAEDDAGRLARAPGFLRGSELDELSEVLAHTVEAEEDEDDELERPHARGFLELEIPEERASLVVERLLYHGPLPKHEAIRRVAEQLRDEGLLHYQRLRRTGRIYTTIREAIELGVRLGDLDRPERNHVRALLFTADEYSKEDWLEVVRRALVPGEKIARSDAVRQCAQWARSSLGLDYIRLRSNGRIDKGLRNAFRTLIRRGELEAVSRDEVRLRAPAPLSE